MLKSAEVIVTAVDVIHSPEPTASHSHREHELLWHVAGNFRVEVAAHSWSVNPGTGIWLESGTVHRTIGSAPYSCGWALVDTTCCPALWARTTPVVIEPLLRALLDHLATSTLQRVRREAEAVVFELLGRKFSTAAMELMLPTDERCRQIVEALLADPTHPWSLSDWSIELSASSRTLGRIFLAETGMTFGQWRAQARLRFAMVQLADGLPVAVVARRVGFQTPSAFVTAFRRLTGTTPGAYAEDDSVRRIAVRSAS